MQELSTITNQELVDKLKSIVGHSITAIHYIPTKFHYSTPTSGKGDWANVNPDLFVLHSSEWQFELSNGQTLFIRAKQVSTENFASKFVVADETIASKEDTILTMPRQFKWPEVLGKPIKRFCLWQRVISSSKLLGREYDFKYQDGYQIIQLTFGGQTLSLTTMDGDLGDMVFYATGYLGERIGLFINKTICTSHTVYNLTMRMALTYRN